MMMSCKPVTTPLAMSEKLSCEGGVLLGHEDSMRYRSIVGALQYLTMTHPDISFSINKACQYDTSGYFILGQQGMAVSSCTNYLALVCGETHLEVYQRNYSYGS
jgi:hypothetical protein